MPDDARHAPGLRDSNRLRSSTRVRLLPRPGCPPTCGCPRHGRLLDRSGYDLIGIQDHPYQSAHLDTLSLLGVILGQTSSVRVFADVADLPMRSPAVLAKAAATLDLLSGGRLEMGIGAGGFLQAAHAMGAPKWTAGQRLAALEEAVAVMRAMWGGEHRGLRFDGRYQHPRRIHRTPHAGQRH
jgi:alkanesulfonate monooxygenase SsuD/methylene tetrahydromethanopterin reductase-like flavin-dependent oxidoreductase (luciferase family)